MTDWPEQPEYPEGDLPRPSAAQLWRMWRSERKRADFEHTIGRQWMEAWKDVRAEREHAVAALAEQIAALTKERDAARRVSIALQADLQRRSGAKNWLKETEWQARERIAKDCGWDYLLEHGV